MDKNNITQCNIEKLLHILIEAEDDVISGRVAPMQQTFDDIKSRLKES